MNVVFMSKLLSILLLVFLFGSLKAESPKAESSQTAITKDDVNEDFFLNDGKDAKSMFFQKPNTPVMREIVKTHNIIFGVMVVVLILCCGLLLYTIIRFSEKNNPKPAKFTHNTGLEIAWTVIPLVIALGFSFFNLKALHRSDIQEKYDLTIKVVGHQWYWTYEYQDEKIKFDSYMKNDPYKGAKNELKLGDKRLLSVDNPLYVPVGKNVRIIVTADDVIHSWAVPAFGVKKDTVPGRLNETWFKAERTGVFYGQCSELCGLLHGFMPIEIHVVDDSEFANWVTEAKSKFAV